MCPDRFIHERRLPGGVVEQLLPAADAAAYLNFPPLDRRIRQTLENLRWHGTLSTRLGGKSVRCWRRYIRVVEP